MNRQEFRDRMNQYKLARENDPLLKYWEWKKYADGTDGVDEDPPATKMPKDFGKWVLNLAKKDLKERSELLNKEAYDKETASRQRLERAAHHSAAGDLFNLISYLFDSNSDNAVLYNGTFTPKPSYNTVTINGGNFTGVTPIPADLGRDLVRNFIYGDDKGFTKSKKKHLTVNGKVYTDRQYEGNIFPANGLYLPESMRGVVDSLYNEKKIFSLDSNKNYSPDYINENRAIDNVALHSGVFRKNRKGYSAELFDLWDFAGNYDYTKLPLGDKFLEMTAPTRNYPNAGPFILRQEIPITFLPDDKLEDVNYYPTKSFMRNLNNIGEDGNEASTRLNNYRSLFGYSEGSEGIGEESERRKPNPNLEEAKEFMRNVFGFIPYLGDALDINDIRNDFSNGNYGKALAGAALLAVPNTIEKSAKVGVKAMKKVMPKYIPTVNRSSVTEQLNKITGVVSQKAVKESDWNNMRNRSIERLYDKDVRERAALIKYDYGVDLQSTYDKVIDLYENAYHTLPQAEIVDLPNNARAMMDLQEEAARRYKLYGIKPKLTDFTLKVDKAVSNPTQEITNHEMNHFNQYVHQNNPSWNKSDLSKITEQFKDALVDKNPIDPEHTSYFSNWMELNAYGINLLDRLKEAGIELTKENLLKYLKSLPNDDSVKKAALQFKNIDEYMKWLNTMPLANNDAYNKDIENYNLA